MFRFPLMAAYAFVAGSVLAADIVPGDARRGEQLFESERCIQCHSWRGRGGTLAPDLARRFDRGYTPALMASLMWNHAPAMWEAMEKNGVTKTSLTPEAASDLFAYFVAARYFEKPGDAARGKLAFSAHHCAQCHGITASPLPAALPVEMWDSLMHPIVLAQRMWNHGAKMHEEFRKKKLAWSRLTGQELTDILVYLQNLPRVRGMAPAFTLGLSEPGSKLFESKGCAACHTGPRMSLENRLRNQTLTEIAADMWNHQPFVKSPPELSPDEMRQIIGYVWERQYFQGTGNVARGHIVFVHKGCDSCHGDVSSGAPKLERRKAAYSDITMVAALWNHGPTMLESMKKKGVPWPRFTAQQMTDLIAFLNSLPAD